MSVSDATQKALREAMQRLMTGKPMRTDGAVTKENLYKEAQVSRATMNRATEIMAEWDAHLVEHGRRTKGEAMRDGQLAEVSKKLAIKTKESADRQTSLDAAATVIAALHHDNQALREHLDSRSGKITNLAERRAERRAPAAGPLPS